jgi:hypothetical protein
MMRFAAVTCAAPSRSAAGLVISLIEAPAVPPQHERRHVPKAACWARFRFIPHRGATFALLTV